MQLNERHRALPLMVSLLLTFLPTIPGHISSAQDRTAWHNKTCAVSLTYDDALNVHLDNAVPILDSLGFKATFYLSGFFPAFRERSADWRTVANNGHELGNHTLFHPCEGSAPGREWVRPDYDLNNYTMRRLLDEITMANILLKAIDGRAQRTFAYPCGDTRIGDSEYVTGISDGFVGARGVEGKIQRIDEIDPYRIGSHMIAGQSGEELIGLVKKAMKENALVVFLFHGVGGEHALDVSLDAHRALLHFLKQHEDEIWVSPLVDIAAHVKAYSRR